MVWKIWFLDLAFKLKVHAGTLCIETKLPQNLNKNINSSLISTFLPKKSSQKILPEKILPKNFSKKIPPKKSQNFPKIFKNFPKISKQFLKKFLRFWKYPIPYITLGGRKPFRACLLLFRLTMAMVCDMKHIFQSHMKQRKIPRVARVV